jgi:signal transduction histidine kinase
VTLGTASLRTRLVVGATAVGLTFAVVFGVAATWRVHHAEDRAVHASLLSRLELARDEVAADGTLSRDAGSPKTDLVQVLGADGQVLSSSPALVRTGPLADIADVRRTAGGVESRVALQRPDVDLAVLAVPLPLRDATGARTSTGALVVAVDAEGFGAATADLVNLLLVGLVVVVLTIALLSWVLTGRALRSVARLTESAESVGPSDLGTGLPVPRHDAELARLVAALNRMLVRLHESHTAELAFAADAGHRLRTPVATLRAEAELALREPDPSEQAAALERIVRDADQLGSIVDRMLARSRAREYAPETVADALGAARLRWQRQADLADVTLSVRLADTASRTWCVALTEIVEPIIDNGFRHTPAGGRVDVEVHVGPDGAELVVDVRNTGAPVPAELAPQLFDAWVSSRDASEAGGLGLWLARETARDQGGDVTLNESTAKATVFRIVLPALVPPG